VKPSFIEALAEHGLTDLSVDELVQLAIHGIKPDFVAEMKAMGFEDMSVDELVQLGIHGVNAKFVQSWMEQGLDDASVDELVELRIHGVKPRVVRRLARFIMRLREHGYDMEAVRYLRSLDIEQFSDEFMRSMHRLGYKNLTMRQLIDMWIYDVNIDYVESAQGDSDHDLTMDEIIALRSQEEGELEPA
jgi:hypothetical protein